jgi:uncharacterized protein (TIGR02145 family)
VELVATKTINFTLTPYTVIFSNNGMGTSKGWVEGNIPSPPPRNSTYAFLIDSGIVQAGDVVYVGGNLMTPTGILLRVKNTSADNGDGGIGGAFTGASGVLGNGGGIADGVAVFKLHVSQIDSNSIPVDAIFYGAGIGDAALADTTLGFTLPSNDRYSGGRLKSSSFLAPEVIGFYSLQASGSYNNSTGIYSLPRTWSTNGTAWISSTTSLSVGGNTYLWSNGATTKNISGLSAGTYTVTVTSSGCTVSGSYTVIQSIPLSLILTTTSTSCPAASNGALSSSVSGGVTPYKWFWSNGATTQNISGQPAANYTLTVTDAAGCTASAMASIIAGNNVPLVTLSPGPAICNGATNGNITTAVSAGTPPHAYMWSNGATTTSLIGLVAGTYTLTVSDANGCATTQSANIVQTPAIVITAITPNINSAGYPVNIVGSGLGGITQVKFNVVNAASFSLSGDTLVNAIVPVNANTGTIELVNSAGCTAQSATTFTYLFSTPNLTVKLYLQGLYVGGGFMELPLVNSGLSGNAQHADSIELRLASASAPYSIFYSGRVLLLSTGVSVLNLPGTVIGQQYYIVVRHRNSLETWSKQPVIFSASTYYNFSGAQQFPEVTINAISAITNTTAQGGGNVSTDGGSAVTSRGICWSTSPGPTVALATKTVNGIGTGSFISSISGLQAATTYYLRAYATNGVGTAYSNEVSFLTANLVEDIDGNIYDTVLIGTQVWMSKNLRVSKYRNGDPIPTNLSNTAWQNTISGAYSIYDNIPANDSIYGKLYNWYAVADPRWLCPVGWHVPSVADWTTLENYLGGSSVAGGKMKAVSSLWNSPNTGASNSSGFTALPGGAYNGFFNGLGNSTHWWTSTRISSTSAWGRPLFYDYNAFGTAISSTILGQSVRCLRGDIPKVITTAVTTIDETSAICGGQIAVGDSVTVRGVCWSTNPLPTISLGTKTTDGSGAGSFTSYISGLQAATTYYVRAYATNNIGTAYGSEISFTTTINLPWVTTTAISSINNSMAQSGGSVTTSFSPITSRGICWSTNPAPTVALTTKTVNGSGVGTFVASMTGLQFGTNYYVRAYATNGAGTAYGNEYSFTTTQIIPQIATTAIMNISNNSAQCGGSITVDGGSFITSRGVCWSTSPNPTVALPTKTNNGSGIGTFNSSITGLQLDSTYYIRAYATNDVGTGYGQESSITILAAGQVTDINGNYYDTIRIGSQTWMVQNLKVSKYRNGDLIPTGLANTTWQSTTSGAYAVLDNNIINDSIYGKLYNWYSVNDPRGLCPVGWHVPSDVEWTTLESLLGGNTVAGGKLKAISPLWFTPNNGATNISGFTGLPGCLRDDNGLYDVPGWGGYWWSTTQSSTTYAWARSLRYNLTNSSRGSNIKKAGFSVRCVKD